MSLLISKDFTLPDEYLIHDNWIGLTDLCKVAAPIFGVDFMTIYLQTREPGTPQPKVAMRMGTKNCINKYDAVDWLRQLEEWRGNAEARATARKAEEDRKFWARFEAEQERLKKDMEVLRQQLEATAQRMEHVKNHPLSVGEAHTLAVNSRDR
ncbi:MAG: hypothetical protein ACHQX3_07750 [Nitrospirales bacterium]